jgi:nickel-dependent lactate racemase
LPDQWEVQVQALIQRRARCFLYSGGLSPEQIRGALLEPVVSLEQVTAALLQENPEAQIAVLPQGPQTIPYFAD